MSDIEKGGQEFAFWADLFQFRKRYYEPPKENPTQEETFWVELIKAADTMINKYKDAAFNKNDLVRKQLLCIVADLEAKYMNK